MTAFAVKVWTGAPVAASASVKTGLVNRSDGVLATSRVSADTMPLIVTLPSSWVMYFRKMVSSTRRSRGLCGGG